MASARTARLLPGRLSRLVPLLLLLAFLPACDLGDDLFPSSEDRRPVVVPGTPGPYVGQTAPDFTLPDTAGGTFTLSSTLPSVDGAVLYFTMWCPICDAHMSHLRAEILPAFPGVRFLLVDYVSGSVAEARSMELSTGYAASGFTTVADAGAGVLASYAATMGTTVVIDNAGVVRMNEDYRDGSRLRAVLSALP